jgi:hypothetical protein
MPTSSSTSGNDHVRGAEILLKQRTLGLPGCDEDLQAMHNIARYSNLSGKGWDPVVAFIVNFAKDFTDMQQRTFFLVSVAPDAPFAVKERFTCPDIRQQLVVEQVDARLTGQPLTIDNLVTAYPEAVRATHYWGAMKTQAHADNSLRGPFILVSEGEPTDDDLLRWYMASTKAPITQESKDAEALAATGFLRPVIDVMADAALNILPKSKTKGKRGR